MKTTTPKRPSVILAKDDEIVLVRRPNHPSDEAVVFALVLPVTNESEVPIGTCASCETAAFAVA
jgi:hypothetical protein